MATVALALTALALYRYLRSAKAPETALVAAAFPRDLQDQIVADFGGPVALFCATRLERRRLVQQDRRTRAEQARVLAAAASPPNTPPPERVPASSSPVEEPGDDDATDAAAATTAPVGGDTEPQTEPPVISDAPETTTPTATPITDTAAVSQELTDSTATVVVTPTATTPSPTKRAGASIDLARTASATGSAISGFFRRRLASAASIAGGPASAAAAAAAARPPGAWISPSADPPQWDPAAARKDAATTLLLLWAVVDLLKKSAALEGRAGASEAAAEAAAAAAAVTEAAAASRRGSAAVPGAGPGTESNGNEPAGESAALVAAAAAALSASAALTPNEAEDEAVAANGTSGSGDVSAAAADTEGIDTERIAAMTQKEREREILTGFRTESLVALLQMVQAVESLLMEKFTLLRLVGMDTFGGIEGGVGGPVHIDGTPVHAEPSAARASVVTTDGGTYDARLLHIISLGWGVVGLILETASKEELVALAERNGALWEGENAAFLVETIVDLLQDRGEIEPFELLRL
ncbi:hypothetical protein HK405_005368 [Cladochytrium tenue]|nr:hypothetical protein HK405_005368 [Cladochytrium tenue]